MIRLYQTISPRIATSAFIDETALIIGNVSVGEDSSIWPFTVARGDVHRIEIGHNSNIQDGSILHVSSPTKFAPDGYPLIIGNGVTVGHRAILHACEIEDDCLIGIGSIVLDGAVVKSGALLGANSMVPPNKVIEGGYLWLGSPAKKVRALSDEEKESFHHSAQHYVNLKNKHKG